MVALGDHGGLAEGPAQIGVAHLAAGQSLDLAGAGHRALDQATVAEEVLHGREASMVSISKRMVMASTRPMPGTVSSR